MTTLYVVTSGCTVNHDEDEPRLHIDRIFSTRAKAEEWIGPAGDEYAIEERTLDDIGTGRPMRLYNAMIRIGSGEVFGIYGEDREHVQVMPIDFQSESTIHLRGYPLPDYPQESYIDACSSVSVAHAIEVAKRERERCMASGGRASG